MPIISVQTAFSNQLFHYTPYYAVVCGAHLRVISPGNTALFEETLQRWRAVGNTMSDLTSPRFEPQTSRSTDERINARPTGRFIRSFAGLLLRIH